ncbi:MAG: folate-binding protein [Pseudomonadota bacterium]
MQDAPPETETGDRSPGEPQRAAPSWLTEPPNNSAPETEFGPTLLTSRTVLSVRGAEAVTFLDGLVTAPVAAMAPGEGSWAALLSPQGKVLFEFIVYRDDDGLLIDMAASVAVGLMQRLSLYKLRADVTLAVEQDLAVVVASGAYPGLEPDARHAGLGYRGCLARSDVGDGDADAGERAYERRRISLLVPEVPADFDAGVVFAHDIGLDQLGGVSFSKGCYVGQEVVSRMRHRGTARRRIVGVRAAGELPARGADLLLGDKTVGTLGRSADGVGLTLARIDRLAKGAENNLPLKVGDADVTLFLPDYATYSLDAQAAEPTS